MEAVIFVGIQASGKSTFFKERFFDTHVRINGDMLRTKHREAELLDTCLQVKQNFVLDKTNLTRNERTKIISKAKGSNFKIIGYYFQTNLGMAMKRNDQRVGGSRIPEKGLLGSFKKLQIPSEQEGFDELFYVSISDAGRFTVEAWKGEV